jgi:hypothetical protein
MARKKQRAWGIGALLIATILTAALPAQAASVDDRGRPAATVDPAKGRPTEMVKRLDGIGAQSLFYIRNKANLDCIYAAGTAGDYVRANGYCFEYGDTLWALDQFSDGAVRLRNAYFGTCAYAAGSTNNSYVKTWNCGTYEDQKWDMLWDNDGTYFRLQNRKSKLCMVHRYADYGPVQQYACGSYADQRWALWQ